MHVKRVRQEYRPTDDVVGLVLRSISGEERRFYLGKLLHDCEAKIAYIQDRITDQESQMKAAAVEYSARRQIFENAVLDDLATAVQQAQAQIETHHDEIGDLQSLASLCREELQGAHSLN